MLGKEFSKAFSRMRGFIEAYGLYKKGLFSWRGKQKVF